MQIGHQGKGTGQQRHRESRGARQHRTRPRGKRTLRGRRLNHRVIVFDDATTGAYKRHWAPTAPARRWVVYEAGREAAGSLQRRSAERSASEPQA